MNYPDHRKPWSLTNRFDVHVPRSVQALQAVGHWKKESTDQPDHWLRVEIAKGFSDLLCLRLGNTPAVEMLPFVAEQWVNVIGEGMNEQQDRDRVKAAFKQLYRTLKWWPQPAELLKALPVRKPLKPSQTARAATDAEGTVSDGVERIQNIMDMLDEKRRAENLI